ncbi:MAG TPA: CHRD domain-containing protein [Pirellulales bacterium]|nr:CHRD domain-containing protein [Pirellulales bacterium]
MLKSGYVLVANVPNNGAGGLATGAVQVLDTNGNLLETLQGPPIADPWDMTVNDQGATAQLFFSNVSGTSGPNGSVWRIDLSTPPGGNIAETRAVQLGSGYNTRLDANAFVVGPGGLAYDAATDTLYVASQAEKVGGKEVGTIFSIANAGTTNTNGSGEGTVVFADATHLHGPIGLVLAPNGDLITANSDAVNADPNQPSELVEFTKTGQFVGQFSVDPANGGAFGLAVGTVAGEYRLAAVDDNVPNISFYDFQPTSPTVNIYSATISWGDGTSSAGTITFAGGTFTVSGTHTYADDGNYTVGVSVSENGISQFFSTLLTGAQQVPPVVTNGNGGGSIFLSGDQTTITVNSSFANLQGNATAAHLHNAPAGANGPIAKDANGNNIEFAGVPAATSGIIPTQSFTVNAGFVGQLVAGNIYENIHTTANTAGEIRGQFTTTSFATSTAAIAETDATLTAQNVLVGEGKVFNGQVAVLTDPGSTDPASDFSATINWGDGTSNSAGIVGANGTYTLLDTHTYAEDGHYTITVSATEKNTPPFTVTATATADVAEDDLTVQAKPIAANENQAFTGAVATFTDPSAVQTLSTVPGNGDVNPYGVAIVPAGFPSTGVLLSGDTLIANFNNSANVQGTGTTIMLLAESGQRSTFFTSAAPGLDTGLVVLKSGFVIVANVPNNGAGGLLPGSLQVLDPNGNLVETITNPALLADPWDLAVNDQGTTAQLFVSNVSATSGPNGTVTRVDLSIPPNGIPIVQNMVQIASGFNTRLDANAFVVGPGGLAYDSATGTLYVASQAEKVGGVEVGTIFSIANAGTTNTDNGKGTVVYADPTHLHGPIGLVLAPNGDLITANSDAVNADPNQPSELVEFTKTGQFVGQFSVDPANGGAFGLAIATVGGQYRLAAVDDNVPNVSLYDFQPTSPTVNTFSASINWGDGTSSAGTITFAGGTFTVSGSHTFAEDGSYPVSVAVTENGVSQLVTTTLSGANQVPPTASVGTGTANLFLSPDQTTLTVQSSYSGLSGPPTAAHLHNAAAGANGPVAKDANGNNIEFTGVPAAATGTIPQQTFTVNAAFVNQLLAGNIYENIHTAAFPSGEVRGQFTPTNFSSATATVAESDATITAATILTAEGLAFSGAVATLSDPGSPDPVGSFTATINWGDGTSSTGVVSGSAGAFTISGTHTYVVTGHYPLTVSATENGVTPNPIATGSGLADVAESDIAIKAQPIKGIENQTFAGTVATFTDAGAVQTFSTVPGNGDVNPYGNAIVPAGFPTSGILQPGDTLISNFNNAGNTQGTGTTIIRITPSGQQSTFFTSAVQGLDTGLVVLRSGFVIVANVPNDGKGGLLQGSLQVLDANGHLVETITDPTLLADPWDLAVNDQGSSVQLFVSNVSATTGANGTVTRVNLTIPPNGIPQVQSKLQIASGYATRLDANAFVVGPGGLAYDTASGTLYVASQAEKVGGVEVGTIFSIANAGTTTSDNGKGTVVFADPVHLHGPIGLVLAPNGNLITANSDAVNADPKQPSELVEFTKSGQFVGQFSIDPANGGAFGLAVGTVGGEYRLTATDDNVPNVSFYDFQPTSPTVTSYTALINWGDGTSTTPDTSAGTITFQGGTFTITGAHTYADDGIYPVSVSVLENGVSQLFTVSLSGNQQVPPTGSPATGTANVFLSADRTTLTVDSSFSGLQGGLTEAHLHAGQAGQNGPVEFPFSNVPTGATSGSIPQQTFNVTSAELTQLLAGDLYENIHTSVFAGGEIRGQVTAGAGSTTTATVVAATPQAEWADNLYEDLLGREIEQSASAALVAAQNSGVSRLSLAFAVTHSPEYLTDEINQAYQQFLGRAPDPQGLRFWLIGIESGLSYELLEAQLIGSPEFYQHAGGTNQTWLNALYFDLLGRMPDTQGNQFWLQALANGEPRIQVALGFTTSAEREAIVIRNDYQTLLGRTPSDAEVQGWVNAYENGLSNENIVTGFVASDEYFAKIGAN